MATPISIDRARTSRLEGQNRKLRNALASCNEIARRSYAGHGETVRSGLASIDRISAQALNEARP